MENEKIITRFLNTDLTVDKETGLTTITPQPVEIPNEEAQQMITELIKQKLFEMERAALMYKRLKDEVNDLRLSLANYVTDEELNKVTPEIAETK